MKRQPQNYLEKAMIYADNENGIVIVEFDKPICFWGMTLQDAKRFIEGLLSKMVEVETYQKMKQESN